MTQAFLKAARQRGSGMALHKQMSRHKTPLTTKMAMNKTGMQQFNSTTNALAQLQRGPSGQTMRSKMPVNRDLSNLDRISQKSALHFSQYGFKRKLITAPQVKELLMPVQRITGSRAFGDKLEDYQELCK